MQFDIDADAVLNTTLAGSVDRKIEVMTTIIYNIGMDRSGVEQGKKNHGKMGRRTEEKEK